MSEPLDVLAIMAHPDDAELLCGGALIKSGERGERTGVLDLTRGETGTRGSADLRDEEAARAAEVLGLAVRRNAGLTDSGLEISPASRRIVVDLLRELRPRVVVTHWTTGRHPDHSVAAHLVYESCYLSGLANFQAHGDPYRPSKVVHAITFREDAPKPTLVLDISEQMERKVEALRCYSSQFEGLSQAGEVFPGGDRPLFDQIRAQCAHYGSLIRTGYGEPFWTRETVEADTLGSLSVDTF
jgi:bacillithiol biosynthesis deacetylase BshB1